MATATFDTETLRKGQEGHDLDAITSLYADDAEVRIVDANNPPSNPRRLRGREEITAYWENVLGRQMTHTVENVVAGDNRAAFQMACEYPDGTRVLCSSVAELEGGKIAREVIVQAWDS